MFNTLKFHIIHLLYSYMSNQELTFHSNLTLFLGFIGYYYNMYERIRKSV